MNFIICEFNPFHNGHAYLLSKCADGPNICIMSSHVTQRGDFAFTDKWTRCEMALRSGADLVIELPAPFAMGQAELFAKGAVEIIKATGLNGRICFGTEGAAEEPLRTLAKIEEERLSPLIKENLAKGVPYAKAIFQSYATLVPDAADILNTPNNVLALEYIRASKDMDFIAVPRKNAAHDSEDAADGYCSASYLRRSPHSYPEVTPKPIHHLYQKVLSEGLFPDVNKKDLLWLHALRGTSVEVWDALAPDGIGRRFYKAVASANTIEALLSAVKTKCCTLASLRRIALKTFIGQPPTLSPQYIRVLGANETGRRVLKEMQPTLPVIIKPAAVTTLPSIAGQLMEYESRLTDTYMFLLSSPKEKGKEFLTSPIML